MAEMHEENVWHVPYTAEQIEAAIGKGPIINITHTNIYDPDGAVKELLPGVMDADNGTWYLDASGTETMMRETLKNRMADLGFKKDAAGNSAYTEADIDTLVTKLKKMSDDANSDGGADYIAGESEGYALIMNWEQIQYYLIHGTLQPKASVPTYEWKPNNAELEVGNWMVWDITRMEYVDTGVVAYIGNLDKVATNARRAEAAAANAEASAKTASDAAATSVEALETISDLNAGGVHGYNSDIWLFITGNHPVLNAGPYRDYETLKLKVLKDQLARDITTPEVGNEFTVYDGGNL